MITTCEMVGSFSDLLSEYHVEIMLTMSGTREWKNICEHVHRALTKRSANVVHCS